MAEGQFNFRVNLDNLDDVRNAATVVLILSWNLQKIQLLMPRQIVQTSALTGQQWMAKPLHGYCTRMLENMSMNVPTFINFVRYYRMTIHY